MIILLLSATKQWRWRILGEFLCCAPFLRTEPTHESGLIFSSNVGLFYMYVCASMLIKMIYIYIYTHTRAHIFNDKLSNWNELNLWVDPSLDLRQVLILRKHPLSRLHSRDILSLQKWFPGKGLNANSGMCANYIKLHMFYDDWRCDRALYQWRDIMMHLALSSSSHSVMI